MQICANFLSDKKQTYQPDNLFGRDNEQDAVCHFSTSKKVVIQFSNSP